jgi:hypothetical protein
MRCRRPQWIPQGDRSMTKDRAAILDWRVARVPINVQARSSRTFQREVAHQDTHVWFFTQLFFERPGN